MKSKIHTTSDEFQNLFEGARALGLSNEAAMIGRRAASADGPLLFSVVGNRSAGKSAVINALAGNAIARASDASASWINVYKTATGAHEYAEIYRRGAPDRAEILSIEQAQRLHDDPSAQSIERIVWTVKTPDLPENISLAEIPANDIDRYCWESDIIMWVIRSGDTSAISHMSTVLDRLQRNELGLPFLCVITHMDSIPKTEWREYLNEVQHETAGKLDRITPFALYFNQKGVLLEGTTAPVRLEVRSRFFHGGKLERQRQHTRFIEAMRQIVLSHFEELVDRVLEGRWKQAQYRQELSEDLNRQFRRYSHSIRHLLDGISGQPLSDHQNEPVASNFEAEQAADRLLVFLEQIVAYTHERAAQTTLASSGGDSSQLLLPPPPPRAVSLLRTVASGQAPAGVELGHVAEQASGPLAGWLDRTRTLLESRLVADAGRTFERTFGFKPENTPAELARLEAMYMRIRGKKVAIPSPKSGRPLVSPATFLCHLQEPGYIEQWNKTIVATFFEKTLPEVHRRFREHIERTRDLLLDEWERCRPMLNESVLTVWNTRRKKYPRAKQASWSVNWAASLMRGSLREPARYFVPPSGTLRPGGASLLVGRNRAAFLNPVPADRPSPALLPGDVVIKRMHESVIEEADRCWHDDHSIHITTSLRQGVWQRVGVATLLLLIVGAAWISLFGTGIISISLLPMLLATHTGASWHFIERFINQAARTHPNQQSEQLHQFVRSVLNERVDQVEHALGNLMLDDSFRQMIESEVKSAQAERSELYLPYRELIRRLESTPGALVSTE